jgi:hypothetical protein
MAAVPGLKCPECGRTARDERRLHKSRRRWGWATLAVLLLLLAAPGVSNGRLSSIDWFPYMPTWFLIDVAETFSSPPGVRNSGMQNPPPPTFRDRARMEVEGRYARGRLSLSSRKAIARRTFTPTSPPLQFETRAVWPIGVPVVVRAIGTFSGPLPREIRADSGWSGGHTVVARDRGVQWYGWSASPYGVWENGLVSLGTPPPGPAPLSVNAVIYEGDEVVWSGTISVPVSIAGPVEAVITPVRSPAADRAVSQAVSQAIIDPHALALELPLPTDPALYDLAVPLRISFRRAGAEVASAAVQWRLSEADAEGIRRFQAYREPGGLPYATAGTITGDTAALARALGAETPDAAWTVVVTADPALALSDFGAAEYWEGKLELPLPALSGPAFLAPKPRK